MCLFCVLDHSKYFLKNLLRGWEKLTLTVFFIEGFPKVICDAQKRLE